MVISQGRGQKEEAGMVTISLNFSMDLIEVIMLCSVAKTGCSEGRRWVSMRVHQRKG